MAPASLGKEELVALSHEAAQGGFEKVKEAIEVPSFVGVDGIFRPIFIRFSYFSS